MKKREKTMKLVNLESVGNVIDESGVTYPMLADGGYDIFGGIHIHDIENEEWFESLSEEDLDVVGEISDSLLTEKEKSDFNDAMNGDYTGFDSFLENNLIA
jgi:hypothetical protein|tara:strand:+ start:579 stop:881 length:303 start_codon:yes stop_codon:yes gene_type:complete